MSGKILDILEQVRAARDAGFDLISTGQHYLSAPYQMSAVFPLLGRLAAEAGDMYIASTVILVPLHNPVELAESVATMDSICNGRFIFGVGLGYRHEEYTAFGIRSRERVGRLIEALTVMKLLWTEDDVEFEGKYYKVPRTKSIIRSVQKPYPQIWVAASNDAAIRRAGRLGYPWLINPHATLSMVGEQLELYRAAVDAGGQSKPEMLPMVRELYVAQDHKTAFLESRTYLEDKYHAYTDWGQDKAMPGGLSFNVPYEDLAHDRFLLGSAKDIVDEIQRYSDELGINFLIFRMQWPGMDQAQVLQQIEIMGRDVIPRFKSAP